MPEPHYNHLKCHTDQGVLVLTVTEAQIQSDELAEALRVEMIGAVTDAVAPKVAIDMGRITYLSSIAFRPLLSMRRKIQELSGRLVLCNMNPHITEVFTVTRLVSTTPNVPAPFEMQPSVAAAVASLNAAKPG